MISLAVKISSFYGKDIVKLLADYGFITSYGEYMEIENDKNNIDERQIKINVDNYLERIKNKSASLFESAAYVGAILGNGTEDEKIALKNFGNFFGISYQLLDDLKDIKEDLKNFVVTLPFVLLYKNLDENDENELKRLIEKFKNSKVDEIINLMKEHKIFDKCRIEINNFLNKTREEIEILRKSKFKNYLL
ncbi:MAG: polyprenyl synthetase family protein, partial [Acinetobacter pittii]